MGVLVSRKPEKPWSDMDMWRELLGDEIDAIAGMRGVIEKAFDEDKHPRDSHGRWTSGAGASDESDEPAKPPKESGGTGGKDDKGIRSEAKRRGYSSVDLDRLDELGFTEDPAEAGYIHPNGKLVDLSGKSDGGDGGMRALDHREAGGTAGMQEAMALGYIRYTPESDALNMYAEPTDEQYEQIIDLAAMAQQSQGLIVEVRRGLGPKRDDYYTEPADTPNFYREYKTNTPPSAIVDDIRRFWAGDAKAFSPGRSPRLKEFEEDKHPRDSHGRWSTTPGASSGSEAEGGKVSGSGRKPKGREVSEFLSKVDAALDTTSAGADVKDDVSLSAETKKTYKADMESVLSRMPDNVSRIAAVQASKIRFFDSTASLTKRLAAEDVVLMMKLAQHPHMEVLGAFRKSSGLLSLAGGSEVDWTNDAQGNYAHELTHAIDNQIKGSDNKEWIEAWKREIRVDDNWDIRTEDKQPLTYYAAGDSEEGFAEFGRLLWGSPNRDMKAIEEKFPDCTAFFRSRGLLEK